MKNFVIGHFHTLKMWSRYFVMMYISWLLICCITWLLIWNLDIIANSRYKLWALFDQENRFSFISTAIFLARLRCCLAEVNFSEKWPYPTSQKGVKNAIWNKNNFNTEPRLFRKNKNIGNSFLKNLDFLIRSTFYRLVVQKILSYFEGGVVLSLFLNFGSFRAYLVL